MRTIMHMYFAMFASIIALLFLYFRDTIFDHMITTFRFSRIIPFVVQFWVLILPNLGRTDDAFDSIRVFFTCNYK